MFWRRAENAPVTINLPSRHFVWINSLFGDQLEQESRRCWWITITMDNKKQCFHAHYCTKGKVWHWDDLLLLEKHLIARNITSEIAIKFVEPHEKIKKKLPEHGFNDQLQHSVSVWEQVAEVFNPRQRPYLPSHRKIKKNRLLPTENKVLGPINLFPHTPVNQHLSAVWILYVHTTWCSSSGGEEKKWNEGFTRL